MMTHRLFFDYIHNPAATCPCLRIEIHSPKRLFFSFKCHSILKNFFESAYSQKDSVYLLFKLCDMKRIIALLILAASLPGIVAQAQSHNTKCLGVSTGYLFDTENVQIGIFMRLPFAKNWRVAPSVNYAFTHNDLNEWEINGNIHYLVPFAGRFSFYPLAGIAFQSWRGNALQSDKELSNTRNKFGINVGAGLEVSLSHRLDLHLEGKYIFINDFDQAHISLGLGYKF